jgi:UDP-N-acetylglucosamine 2-epimerase (non-hydrolysing)
VKAVLVAAARPNFIKVAPILAELDARPGEVCLVHTGQHYDPSMSDVFFADLDIRHPDVHLGVGSGSHAQQTARIMEAFEPVVIDQRPDVVIVVGDVNSTMAAALVAGKLGVPVAHVEAGLRSRDWTMPEELNRVVTDRCSSWLLAPSEDAVENLRFEGFRPDAVHLVGNVMIDTLLRRVDAARERAVPASLGLAPGGYGVVTLHRPGNVDDPAVLERLLGALGTVARELPLVFPVHPRTRPKLDDAGVPDGILLVDPLGYLDFLSLEATAALALTDSGGVQEETTALGIPCLTLRPNTERPITVSEGTNQVVGLEPDAIVAGARRALAGEVPARCPALWDGKAAVRIADAISGEPPVSPASPPPGLPSPTGSSSTPLPPPAAGA